MAIIYDYETLSQDSQNCAVVCLAILKFDLSEEKFLKNPYTWNELCGSTSLYKFNIKEQVDKYNRIVDQESLDFWKKQVSPEIRKKLLSPSEDDISISEIPSIFKRHIVDYKELILSRGNTFDPIITLGIGKLFGVTAIHPWWTVRDTRSLIEGLSFGSNLSNSFIPDGLKDIFTIHDPIHDVVMDVMRIQTLVRAIHGI